MRAYKAAVLAALVLCLDAHAADWGRALGGLAKGAGDMAQRQINLEADIELAKKRADIEVEKERRLQELRSQQVVVRVAPSAPAVPAVPAVPAEAGLNEEDLMLTKLHPQWERIVVSATFQAWLSKQKPTFARACRDTRMAVVLSLCIDDFLSPAVAKPIASRR